MLFGSFPASHIYCTSLSVLGLYLIAYATAVGIVFIPYSYSSPRFGKLVACLCGNVYIVGLNQLEDVAIDRINKPHLPLAAGEFSRRTAKLIVAITGSLALLLAWLMGPFCGNGEY